MKNYGIFELCKSQNPPFSYANKDWVSDIDYKDFYKFCLKYVIENNYSKIYDFSSQKEITLDDLYLRSCLKSNDIKRPILDINSIDFNLLKEYQLIICEGFLDQIEDPDRLLNKLKKNKSSDILFLSFRRGLSNLTGPIKCILNIREWSFIEFKNYLNQFFSIKRHFVLSDNLQIAICRSSEVKESDVEEYTIKEQVPEFISNEDITFVIHGLPEFGKTDCTIRTIRKFYPKSKIILSTWYGQEKKKKIICKSVDKLVLSDDPGGLVVTHDRYNVNSINRHIQSSNYGVSNSKTKYTVCLRSDLLFLNKNLIKNYLKFAHYINPDIFQSPVAAYSIYSRRSFSTIVTIERYRYNISDFIFFGLTSDLKRLFSIALMTEAEGLYYSYYSKGPSKIRYVENSNILLKFVPESYLIVSYLEKLGIDPKYNHRFDNYFSKEMEKKNKKFIFSNFIIMDRRTMGVKWIRKLQKDIPKQYNCYSNFEWLSNVCSNNIYYKLLYYLYMIVPLLNVKNILKLIKCYRKTLAERIRISNSGL